MTEQARIGPGGPTTPIEVDRSEVAIIGTALRHTINCANGFDSAQIRRAVEFRERLLAAKGELDRLDDEAEAGRG